MTEVKIVKTESKHNKNRFREKFKSIFVSVRDSLSLEKQTIFDQFEKKINSRRHNDVFIYLQMFHHKYRGASAIAAYLGRSKSSIIRSIHKLIDARLVSVHDLVYLKEFKRFEPFEFYNCNELKNKRLKAQTSKKRIYYQFKNFNKVDLTIAQFFRRKKSDTYIPTLSSKRARSRSARSIKYEQLRECGAVVMSPEEWTRRVDELTTLKKTMTTGIDRIPASSGICEWYIDNESRIAPQMICEAGCPGMICEDDYTQKKLIIFSPNQPYDSSEGSQRPKSKELQCESSQDEYALLTAYRDKYKAEAEAKRSEQQDKEIKVLEFYRDKYKAAVVAAL